MAGTPGDEDLRETWRALMQLLFVQRDRFMAAAAELGLTPVHVATMRELAIGGDAPMRALADVLRCDASYVTGIVDRLEQRGFVARRADPADRRIKRVSLTDAGRDAFVRLEAAMFEPPAAVAALAARDRASLRRIVGRLRAQLEAPGSPSGGAAAPSSGCSPGSEPASGPVDPPR
ncbi:MAG: MarR family winged helix-turn-helix transcriptional regulator [Acidimicrobiia bacterium]